jgi:hypothetical protein
MILNHHFRQILAEEHARELRRGFGPRHRQPVTSSPGHHTGPNSQPQSLRLAHQELIPARAEKR